MYTYKPNDFIFRCLLQLGASGFLQFLEAQAPLYLFTNRDMFLAHKPLGHLLESIY